LTARPFVDDVEAIELVTALGEVVTCSRTNRRELFRNVVGGYGLFGVITAVTVRLVPRQKVERLVSVIEIDDLTAVLAERIAAGCLYGDFQFCTAPGNDAFLRTGVLSCYRPVDPFAADSAQSTASFAGQLASVARAGPHGQSPGLRALRGLLYVDQSPALLERTRTTQYLPRGLSRRPRLPPGRGCARQRNDHGAVRAAREARRVHGRCAARLSRARHELIYGTIG